MELSLLVGIEDLHSEYVGVSRTVLLCIGTHVVRHIPATMLPVVFQHLNWLVGAEDGVAGATR